jgi:hypothetical protein
VNATIETLTEVLTLTTPCDRCGNVESGAAEATFAPSPVARAYVLVTLPSGRSLTFCAHHYAAHELALVAAGGIVTDDQRNALDVKIESGFA